MAYKAGDYYVQCDMCRFRRLRSECRYNWENQLVCADHCWEPKHPQLDVRAVPDRTDVPDVRPERHVFQEGNINPEDL